MFFSYTWPKTMSVTMVRSTARRTGTISPLRSVQCNSFRSLSTENMYSRGRQFRLNLMKVAPWESSWNVVKLERVFHRLKWDERE